MEPPLPPPRTKSKSSLSSANSSTGPDKVARTQLIHVAEIHSSKTKMASSSDEDTPRQQREERRKKRVKKKVAEVRRGSLTETLSEDSENSRSSGRIKLAPLIRRRVARGSATETLSEEPSPPSSPPPRANVSSGNINLEKKDTVKAEEMTVEDKEELTSEVNSPEGSSSRLKAPVPLPRRRVERLMDDSQSAGSSISGRLLPTSPSLAENNTDIVPPQRVKRHRKKRRQKTEEETETGEAEDSVKPTTEKETESPVTANLSPLEDEQVVKITLHGCDGLCSSKLGRKPVVRVHIVDSNIANYRSSISKTDEFIKPVEVQITNSRILRNGRNQWEVEAVVSEPVSNVATAENVLLFELLDCERQKVRAWAFLRPVAANGRSNLDTPLRLQLYRPNKSSKDTPLPPVYYWWYKGNSIAGKGTLYLSVRTISRRAIDSISSSSRPESLSSQQPTPSKGEVTSQSSPSSTKCELPNIKWKRLVSQMCKLPNSRTRLLDAGSDGCLCLAFSHSGLLLACPTQLNILIYTFYGQLFLTLNGHKGLIYSVSWSEDDAYLLTASSDSTACLWDIKRNKSTPVQVMSHPSYVYSCCWLRPGRWATGCYDTEIRIWSRRSKDPDQFLSQHKGHVNSLSCLRNTSVLVSADGLGVIIIWTRTSSGSVEMLKELKVREVVGKVINKVSIHPSYKRMLVHTRDSMLRMVDIETGSVIQWYNGGVNRRLRLESGFCGCGSKVFAASEDCTVCIWETDTGHQLGLYSNLASAALSFHPHDHVLALVSHSPATYPRLYILSYQRNGNNKEVGLVLFDKTGEETEGVKVIEKTTPKTSPREMKMKTGVNIISRILGKKKKTEGKVNMGFVPDPPAEEQSNVVPAGVSSDLRLADIIYQMDRILLSAAHDSTSTN